MGYHESIIPIVASVLGSVALILSIYVFKRTLDFQAYREFMKISIEHPYLRDPDKTRDYKIKFTDDKERLTYETYAHLVWNICETAYDRKKIDKTWLPAIKDEKKLHLT